MCDSARCHKTDEPGERHRSAAQQTAKPRTVRTAKQPCGTTTGQLFGWFYCRVACCPGEGGRSMSAVGAISGSVNALGRVPQTMRAGVYREKGIVRVEEVPVPDVGDGEVLIKVAACGVCGTDIKKIFHAYVPPPQILGHELAGTVVAVGRGVTPWKLGDRVMSFHHIPCGKCFYCERRLFSQCKQYKTTGLTAGFAPNGGGFAEYVKAMSWVAERGIVALPDNVSFEEATFIEPINTIVKAVQKARVRTGETVLIIGCGPIGLQLLMVANLEGAKLYTSDPMAVRRAKSLTLGALESFDPSSGKLVEEVKARTDGRGADADLVLNKKLPVMEIVTHRFPLARIQEGLDLAVRPTAESLKILVTHA